MHAAEGILTSRGGMTSHAAVVARGWGKPCIVGCDVLRVDDSARACTFVHPRTGDTIATFREGERFYFLYCFRPRPIRPRSRVERRFLRRCCVSEWHDGRGD